VDTQTLLGGLPSEPRLVERPEDAALVLINTCGFIRPAVEESLAEILDAGLAIRGVTPKPLLAVAGCLVSRYGDDLKTGLPEVDVWLSTHELSDWSGRIAQALNRVENREPGQRAQAPKRAVVSFPGREPVSRFLSGPPGFAYLKISEGCRHACRFCTIPSIRGRLKSRPIADLAAEARHILAQGRKEIILVAQDLTAYGVDLGNGITLRTLLEALLPLSGLERLRLLYLYPAGLTPTFLDFLKSAGPPLVPYFDIPLQHSHPDILKSMGRPFAKDPRRVLDLIRSRFPDAVIRTSLITGYPGETRTHFKHLINFVREARFQHLGVFAFQAEEGTPAAKLSGQVTMKTRQSRRNELMAVQAEISAQWLQSFVGRELDILVDAPHPEWPGLHTGRAWFQAPDIDGVTYVSGLGVTPGAMVKATVEEAKTYDLVALAG